MWQPYYKVHSSRIESIQKQFVLFALRKLGWRNPFDMPSYESRCKLINLAGLERRRLNTSTFFIYDLLTGVINSPNLFALLRLHTPSRTLREAQTLRPEFHRTNYGFFEPIAFMSRLFNGVNVIYLASSSRENFRSRIAASSTLTGSLGSYLQ